VLKGCGLVVGRQEGRFVSYRLADDRLEEVFRAVEDVLADVTADIFALHAAGPVGRPHGNGD
jgi:hypothetical protein